MIDIVLKNPAKSIVDIPREDIAAYQKKHKCSPVEAFSDILSQRLLDKIKEGQHEVVLKILVENVIGKGLKP